MFSTEVYMTIDIVCSCFVLALLAYTITRYDREERTDYFFMLICIVDLVQLLGDVVTLKCSGTAEVWFPWVFKLSYFFQYATGAWICLLFTNYLCAYLQLDLFKRRRVRKFMFMIGVILTSLVILNLRFGFYYRIDPVTNTYSRGPLWIVSQILGTIPLIFDVYLFFKYAYILFRNAWVGTLVYISFPVAGLIVQIAGTTAPVTFIMLSLALYLLFFNVKTEQTFQFEKQRKELAESRISIMLSQIQPHFMYNALTSIAVLCEKDPAEAKRATMNFSRYLRKNIDSVNKRMPVTFTNELEHVQTYLELEKLRFGDNLRVVFDIKAKDFLIPPLTIQPLAENAVKHGICSKLDMCGTLTIRSREYEDRFEVEIEDDGIGFEVNKKVEDGREHIGIENVRNRLLAMSDAKMFVSSTPGIGTIVKIVVPKLGQNMSKRH